jgi:hypothetical protein
VLVEAGVVETPARFVRNTKPTQAVKPLLLPHMPTNTKPCQEE